MVWRALYPAGALGFRAQDGTRQHCPLARCPTTPSITPQFCHHSAAGSYPGFQAPFRAFGQGFAGAHFCGGRHNYLLSERGQYQRRHLRPLYSDACLPSSGGAWRHSARREPRHHTAFLVLLRRACWLPHHHLTCNALSIWSWRHADGLLYPSITDTVPSLTQDDRRGTVVGSRGVYRAVQRQTTCWTTFFVAGLLFRATTLMRFSMAWRAAFQRSIPP